MTAPTPPEGPLGPLDPLALAAWNNAYQAAVQHQIWRPLHVHGLEVLARSASRYIELARAIAACPEPVEDNELPEMRRFLREHIRNFGVLPANASDFLGEVRLDGIDRDIAKLCGI